jgi:hypothetical protein
MHTHLDFGISVCREVVGVSRRNAEGRVSGKDDAVILLADVAALLGGKEGKFSL